ncbi:aldo/keto reductase [Mucilaginibacter gotjawali]|uniref:Aryl-alcohol dehydrogenase-like predicted oxidoreductase n=1 Tax=Mucilaginibacter gotjawali TaxID=1550579 RepID=A0A839SAU1_9SPHI|nr:aldo/keto reductase [Mucilaginibacter gotjawali]MBB3054484.1 aryl-alcohol dehydrogenase-like predicted oxidoreductase [Mucilaginibacter gotjawali]
MRNEEIIIGADTTSPLAARRPGYGTMRLTGEGFYGEPQDRDGAIALLRKAVELGVNFFDTADFYGPGVTNRLLAEALYPYPADLIIATKVGAKRGTDKSWLPYGEPEELRTSVENNLKQLKIEQLPLVHYGKAATSPGDYEEGLATMMALQKEGKILHLGLSNATIDQFNTAIKMGKVASVENMYSYTQRVTDQASPYGFQGGELLPLCEEHQIPFIPFFSLQTSLPTGQDKMKELADTKGVTIAQLNIAWLLQQSAWILPIPGTTSIGHLKENIKASDISLSKEELEFLG